ncbi:MAG TPA: hypothetical protein VFF24_02015 [Acidimicrobiia bacterium]|nr:hypothetical protein [Acidimicrobiia bacterium]
MAAAVVVVVAAAVAVAAGGGEHPPTVVAGSQGTAAPPPLAGEELPGPSSESAVSTTTGPLETPVTSTAKPTTSTAVRSTATEKPLVSAAPPVFREASIDRTARSITLTFDVPVKPNPKNNMGGMLIMVFGKDSTCSWTSGPQGNGHEVLSGSGTPTITFDISGLKPGAVHVIIAEGLVVSADGGVPNERVPCVAVPSGGPVGPTVGLAVADVTHSQVDITFDSDADAGDPAQLFVYGGDSTCTTLAGRGTKIEYEWTIRSHVTVTVAGIIPGVTYIRIGPGLVTGTEGNVPNAELPCRGVQVYEAPKLVKTTTDIGRSTISLTFDQPISQGDLRALHTASDPSYQDSAQPTRFVEKVDGVTIVLELANLRPGTLYVKIGPDLVSSRDGFVSNTEMPWYQVEVEAAH